jgi:methyltransferase-like protein
MLEIKLGSIYKLTSQYSLTGLEGDKPKYWLFDLKNGTIYRLNDISHYILSLLDGNNDVSSIMELILQQYEGSNKNEVFKDLQEFISICLKKGIIYQKEEDKK